MAVRRFPPPWSIEDIGAAFVVKDGSRQTHAMRDVASPAPSPGYRRVVLVSHISKR